MKVLISVSMAAAVMAAPCTVLAQDAAKLAQQKACLACHAIDKKIVGPSYKDVAKKYAGDKGAEAKLIQKVLKGGGGVWGQVPMPPNPTVSATEAKTLVQWVLSQK